MSYPQHPRNPGENRPPAGGSPYFPGAGYQAPPPPKKAIPRWLRVAFFIALAFCIAGVVAAIATNGSDNNSAGRSTAATATQAATQPAATHPATASKLAAANFSLTVHTTSKDCFGSAGCNVDYEIKATLSAPAAECSITYDVLGLEDTQTGTLQLHADGTYDQDSYQSGQTSTSSKKLTAKVTEVDC